jgi:haloalkane dehalogenase
MSPRESWLFASELRRKPSWLEELFPYEQHACVVNGRTMAYVDEGPAAGRPVLLLSGNPTWGFLYRDFIPRLAERGYRAIAPDWIGAGYSDHPRLDAALTLAHHIADLVSLLDQLELRGYVIVGQDWGGPQGVGAALARRERLAAIVLMNTWLFTGYVGSFHRSPRPWTTWHAPIIGQWLMKRVKVLSQHGPSAISRRGMSVAESRAYHHVFDEPESDAVVLTWPRTIPMRPGDRGWNDMQAIERRLGELAEVPALLMWAPDDNVFPIEYAERLKDLLPHAEGPVLFERAAHFLQDDRGGDLARELVGFLDRTFGASS